jgi:hypothetical protein
MASPPARGRGLKLLEEHANTSTLQSPPARGRGLKHVLPIERSSGRQRLE